MVKNHQKKSKKAIFVPKITNTFDFSGQKSIKKSVVFFSDFSHGITHKLYDFWVYNQLTKILACFFTVLGVFTYFNILKALALFNIKISSVNKTFGKQK